MPLSTATVGMALFAACAGVLLGNSLQQSGLLKGAPGATWGPLVRYEGFFSVVWPISVCCAMCAGIVR